MLKNAGKATPVKLPESLNIRYILEIKEIVADSLSKNAGVTLEIEDSAQVDLTFVQLLEAARIYAQSRDKILTLKNPASGMLLDVLQRAGLSEDMSPDTAKFWLHREIA